MTLREKLWYFTQGVYIASAGMGLLALLWIPAYYMGKSNARMDCHIEQLSVSKGVKP